MLTKEYRIVLPLTVEEYHIGQLFGVAEASKNETGGGEGVEVVKNEPYSNYPLLNGKYDKGQYTYKIYHLDSKVPALVRMIAPKGALEIHEEAWNAYPYCRTVLTNPDYMKENFKLIIETMHAPDRGTQENAHLLSPNKTCEPVMCSYKLVTCEFKWFGLQNRIENYIQDTERSIFLNFHRQVFCWIDRWHHLSIADIRELEDRTKKDLDEQRIKGNLGETKA
ncbi:phosphatidylinositol transfer protein alpha isoform-like protein [Sarcoptes scabiei]|uniref:Phosphatidylinositol transfer protein alpha isoform-like protein n=1 Tax=Sarcoptes scabiei TaxID=52283 RepID=A0A132AH23_SARSC|nr:phosphatidylinositol transfer protein alpha isoform-like protein [Sarcoptes scabiei]